MSYARKAPGASDVYVIGTRHALECLGCRITGDPAPDGLRYGLYATRRPADMLAHLAEHQAQGHQVPQYTLTRLRREARHG